MKILLNFSRIFVGILFIISGIIKANDPSGFAYKLEEYFTVFGIEWFNSYSVFLSIFICGLEILMGIALLIGFKANKNAWALLGLILFFTWLTGYSAITGKVTDCGCFGDALKLSPWQSFYKDLLLLFFISIIFIRRKSIQPFFHNGHTFKIMTIGTLVAFGFGIFTYSTLPLIDFLPYKVGNNIVELMKIPEGAPKDIFETKMFYQKEGLIKEFTSANYPWEDSTWKWVETKTALIKEGYKAPIHDFKISDADGNEYTEDLLIDSNYSLWVISLNLNKSNKRKFLKAIDLALELEKSFGIKTIGITASTAYDTEYFRHDLNAAFPFYYCDGTVLKSMIRSNPGIILMKNGKVIMKWASINVPDIKEIEQIINSKE